MVSPRTDIAVLVGSEVLDGPEEYEKWVGENASEGEVIARS